MIDLIQGLIADTLDTDVNNRGVGYLKKYLYILFLIFSLSACSNKDIFVYKGEGDKWEGAYNYKEISEDSYEYEILLTYKDDIKDFEYLSEITIEYRTGTNKVGGAIPISLLNKEDSIIFKNSGMYEGVGLLHEESKIEVLIEWGDNQELFELKYNN